MDVKEILKKLVSYNTIKDNQNKDSKKNETCQEDDPTCKQEEKTCDPTKEKCDSSEEKCEGTNCKANDTKTGVLEDIVYPLYIPSNTYLSGKDKVDMDTG